MDQYSISQASRFSGLKAHTIRAWETRYNALHPARSLGNTRYYDSGQVKRLLHIASLVTAGYTPSQLGNLPDQQLDHLLETVTSNRLHPTEDYFVNQLIAAGLTFDERRFESLFSQCVLRYRLKNTYQHVLLPMLDRVGFLWRCDKASPAQEHFISNLLRRKLFASIDVLPMPETTAEHWLLFLPENEFHELGLLMGYNLIRLSGFRATYLGSNVPLQSVLATVEQTRPDRLLMFTLQPELPASLTNALKRLDQGFQGKKIYLAGNTAIPPILAQLPRMQWLRTIEELTKTLNRIEITR